ncbi:DnaD domain-containing protein [Priestia taiwanensis]|uniref:DNA replication protein n=1 Tax=Priestia taiwanensis TaxID=1347902 RepID=A0A917EKW1_9BACI|nr:DnaD domain-containing protein [Priestia taiwanensis]MBM7361736.1 DNA replication protein [Priestia taiwanensis]GGE56560.1 DNA replication protein [Priestia taiwanensis]
MENKHLLIKWLQEGSIAIPKLLMNNYKKVGLNELEMMVVLHIHTFIESGNPFPTPDEIAEKMTITSVHCTDILRQLFQRGFLAIEQESVASPVIMERYTLQPLWEKMMYSLSNEVVQEKKKVEEANQVHLYSIFEQEFGRPLSPFECDTLRMWEDQDSHAPELIKAALREAVISGKLNFRYIDRILFEWKKNNIKTIEQAQQQGKKFRQFQQQRPAKAEQEYKGTIPFYNWLDQ